VDSAQNSDQALDIWKDGFSEALRGAGLTHTFKIGFCQFKVLITTTIEAKVPAVNWQKYPGRVWDKRSSCNECSGVSKQF